MAANQNHNQRKERAWFHANRLLKNCELRLATEKALSSKTRKFLSPNSRSQTRRDRTPDRQLILFNKKTSPTQRKSDTRLEITQNSPADTIGSHIVSTHPTM